MSRLAKKPISLPSGVSASFDAGVVTLKGPKWTLTVDIHPTVIVTLGDNTLLLASTVTDGADFAQWGLMFALIQSRITGVTQWFTKSLEIQWVGYRADITGSKLTLAVGFSHKVIMDIPLDVSLAFDPANANILVVSGIDAQRVGEFAGKIRSVKTPEPYKWKWIRYVGEFVRRKAGKSWSKA